MLRSLLSQSCLLLFSVLAHAQETGAPSAALKDSVSGQLGIKTDNIYSPALYRTVMGWIGTRYQYGGKTKAGIDCSDFTAVLYKRAYDIDLIGGSGDIFKKVLPVEKSALKEGDMVFFKIRKGHISHVGVYLADNKFAHATTKAGVIISDLNEPYYLRYFYKGGMVSGSSSSDSRPASVPLVNTELTLVNYSKALGFTIDTINNPKLYKSVQSLLEKQIPKKSDTKKNKDGALFCSDVYAEAYGVKLNGSAAQLLKIAKPLSKEELNEGDLVFFKEGRKKATRMGIYLTKNKFVHLSAGKIATISDLNDPAYIKTYFRGGRISNK